MLKVENKVNEDIFDQVSCLKNKCMSGGTARLHSFQSLSKGGIFLEIDLFIIFEV